VTLAGNVAEIVTASETSIVVVTPQADAATGDVVVTSNTGARAVVRNGWEQLEEGVVTSESASGQDGTRIRLTGERLRLGGVRVVSVTLVGVAAEIISESDSTIEVEADASTPGQGDIVITNNLGAFIVVTNGFSFLEQGVITTVSPDRGQIGTRLTISGERLFGGGSKVDRVLLGGAEASIVSQNRSVIIAVASGDGDLGTGDVLLVADTGATITAGNSWTQLVPGVITAVAPDSGVWGTNVIIDGERLLGGGSSVSRVLIGGADAEVLDANDDSILVRAPAGDAGLEDIEIIADTGAATVEEAAFRFLEPGVADPLGTTSGTPGTKVEVCGGGIFGGGNSMSQVNIGPDIQIAPDRSFFRDRATKIETTSRPGSGDYTECVVFTVPEY
jgi:hypothetical protein